MALSRRLGSSLPLLRQLINPESIVPLRSLANPNLAVSEGSRTFASEVKSSGAEPKPKLPKALYGGSGNYASALYLAAAKSKSIEKVESEILDVVQASKKCAIFSQFTKDLSVPKETRVKAIQEIFGEAGFSDVTKNFLAVLASNGRLRNLERIAKRYVELSMIHRKELKVVVTSVIPLPAEEEKELKQVFAEKLPGITLKIEQKIDPSILGGVVVELGERVLDMSIKTRVKQMEKILREPIDF
ncbi:ATP synthase subunit O [Carex littledalei]|uniref:ATP synthase subunit O n=1 Tax=Carex littledalei TaxID=544730 RepID=A0A833R3T7_9POAL|nr:ATP synthase subunit O [Carex littledalei]